jgi:hypothetical protein
MKRDRRLAAIKESGNMVGITPVWMRGQCPLC